MIPSFPKLLMRWLICGKCKTRVEWPSMDLKRCPVCESTDVELVERKEL